jgi:outer membrane receptor for ferric coprogen and ferric-rhodotorulic acid
VRLGEEAAIVKNITVNLIRHEPFKDCPHDLTAQFPMWWTRENMNDVAAPLLREIGGKTGLGYTCQFEWKDYERVKAFFVGLGYAIVDIDERKRDRKLRAMWGEE